MLSITLNPRAELRFGAAFCSPVKLDVSSSRIEPSHPYTCIDMIMIIRKEQERNSYANNLGMQGMYIKKKGEEKNLRSRSNRGRRDGG